MKALITGANGAAAKYLIDHLLISGAEVVRLTRENADLMDMGAVYALLAETKPDAVFHLASGADVKKSFDDQGATFRNNVLGTLNLFEALRAAAIQPRVMVCSTSEVYGQPDFAPITEDFPLAPVNPYAVSKVAQDLLGQMYERCWGIPVVVTRAFGYINPRRSNLSLSTFARQIAEIEAGKREFLEHGNLDSVRTFCDVRDIARAYALAIDQSGVFNIGAERQVSIEEALGDMIAMARVKIHTRFDAGRSRPTDVTRIIPDCTRFRRATGWEPNILLRDSLAWLLEESRARVGAG
jgi:GDP-4-dehydro-6-deoxy-D-mannose reductase